MYKLVFGKSFLQLWQDLRHYPERWLSRLVFLLGPWAMFVAVELLNKNDLVKTFEPWQLFFNLVWYYIIFVLWRMILGRLRRAEVCAVLTCFIFGLVNHYVLRFRGRILFPADVSGWQTAANVLDGFDLSADMWTKQALIVVVAYLFLVAVCPAQRHREKLPRVGAALLAVTMAGYTFAFFCTDMLPSLSIYTEQWNTQKNGFFLNFTTAMRYSRVERPKGYSDRALAELMEQFPAVEGDAQAIRPTNIIVVMNEAFSDLTIYPAMEGVEDPSPFLHGLDTDTIKGWMLPPITGGGTASTEFEVLTGLSNTFLPPHCVAYQLYVKEGVPALSAMMGELGYQTTAFHPYRASGWNRPIVYEYMEFDRQLYNTDVENPYYVRRYISDRSSYKKVFELTEEADGQPIFIFNVTMQNHSGFAQGWRNLDREILLPDALNEADPNAEQYVALVRESDEALNSLIRHYRRVEEPTMIVFFGDHQPSLKKKFFNALSQVEQDEELTVEQNMQRYAVPFFIWTNYDIEEQQDLVISSNFLGPLVLRTAGLPMSGWMNFLSQFSEVMPVVSPAGYLTADGQVFGDPDQLPEEQKKWLDWYEMLAYCGLRDMSKEVQDFYN